MLKIFKLMDKEVKKLNHLLKAKIIDKVDLSSIEIEGIETNDFPDFTDAFISAAKFNNGTDLDDEQLEQLESENDCLVNGMIHENQLYN